MRATAAAGPVPAHSVVADAATRLENPVKSFMQLGLIAMLVALVVPAHAASGAAGDAGLLASASRRIEQAFLQGDTAALARIADGLEKTRGHAGANAKYVDYYAGYASYALAWLYSGHDENKADDCVDAAKEALQRALDADGGFAEAHALLASSYGLEIGMHPLSGMWLGRRAGEHMDEAVRLQPHNPRVILQRAINHWYAPARFGGSRQRAAREFDEAITAFRQFKSGDPFAPTWGEAEAHAWRARVEAGGGDVEAARRDYREALELAPGYAEARAELAHLPTTTPASPDE